MSKIFIHNKLNIFIIDGRTYSLSKINQTKYSIIIGDDILEVVFNDDNSQFFVTTSNFQILQIPKELFNNLSTISKEKDIFIQEINTLEEDKKTLEEYKTEKIQVIKYHRDLNNSKDITTSKGFTFKADLESQFSIFQHLTNWDEILKSQKYDPGTKQYPWGSTGKISKEDLKEAHDLILERKRYLMCEVSPSLENLISKATSFKEVDDINIDLIVKQN